MADSLITSINGMGEVTEPSPGVFATTGMGAEDHMHIANDFLLTGGIVKPGDLLVEENGTPDMSVNVNPGTYYVPNSAHTANSNAQTKFWRGITDNAGGVANVTIAAADGSNPRIDLVCIKVNSAGTPDGDGDGVITVVSSGVDSSLEGTPAASPSAPAVPNDYICIAQVLVGAGVTSIVDANITDRRTKVSLAPVNGPEGMMINGKISRTVASNNLTVAIKTLADNDPSELDPVFVNINGVMHKIVAALSVTLNAGTNWFNAGSTEHAAKEIDYFVYIGYRASDSSLFLGLARISFGNFYSDLSSTNTSERYLAYSGSAPANTDRLTVIGRVNNILGVSASYNWSIPATSIIINKPIYETRWLPYQPAYSASGSMTFTSVTTTGAIYKISYDTVKVAVDASGTTGGTAATTLNATLPLSAQWVGTEIYAGSNIAIDGGAGMAGYSLLEQPRPTLLAARRTDGGNYGLGAGRRMIARAIYSIKNS